MPLPRSGRGGSPKTRDLTRKDGKLKSMQYNMPTLHSIAKAPKAKLCAICQQLGQEFEVEFLSLQDRDWDTYLPLFSFDQGYPQLNRDKIMELRNMNLEWEVEVCDPSLENWVGRLRAQLAARKDLTQAEQDRLVEDAREQASAWGFENAILSETHRIRRNLAVWIPVCNEDGIPQRTFSGCEKQSPEWRQFERFLRQRFVPKNIRANSPANWYQVETWLETFADNAGYGGDAGFVITMDGALFKEWMETQDLGKLIRSLGQTVAEVGVLTFGNGAGHLETLPLDLSKYRLPASARQAGIINNMITDTFGLCDFSSVNTGDGTRWTSNLWFPLKPVAEVAQAS